MRVAVIYSEGQATAGGAWTIQRSILDALNNVAGSHDFILIDRQRLNKGLRKGSGGSIRAKASERFGFRRKHPKLPLTELAVASSEADCAWYLEPRGTPLPLPYIATVWDLAHRANPAFPEVSFADWDWESRELNYSRLLPRATRIIAGTEAGKRQIAYYYSINPSNIGVVPFPVPSRSAPSQDQMPDIRAKHGLHKPFFFYPAQFWPHKNHANLLLALKQLVFDFSTDVGLVLTGSDAGNNEYIRALTKSLELEDRVHFLGFVSRQELESLYREAFALVFPSFFGPDNLPPIEAFSLGCPVAASALEGAEEQLGDAALFFDPSDPSSIARVLERLWRENGLRESLVTKGLAIANQKTPENYVMTVHAMLDEIAAMRRCWGKDYRST